jgi:hypothetical protein|tara:strand:+ start:193 stop:612 length:420 start_codon:yes stop_codon:yes gene_type:complete
MSQLADELRARDDAALRAKYKFLVQVADSSSTSLPEVLASLENEGAMSAAEVARMVLIDEEDGSDEDEHDECESDGALASLAESRGPSPVRKPQVPEVDESLSDHAGVAALVHETLRQREAGDNTNRAGVCSSHALLPS